MNITGPELLAQVDAFFKRHPHLCDVAEVKYKLPHHLLYALGSRETNLSEFYEQHAGDGGHGRGTWQLDDRSHQIPNPFPMDMQADLAAAHIRSDLDFFKGDLKAALSAYNGGRGGAHKGLTEGNSDKYTTGHDYGQDTLDRLHFIQGNRPR